MTEQEHQENRKTRAKGLGITEERAKVIFDGYMDVIEEITTNRVNTSIETVDAICKIPDFTAKEAAHVGYKIGSYICGNTDEVSSLRSLAKLLKKVAERN